MPMWQLKLELTKKESLKTLEAFVERGKVG